MITYYINKIEVSKQTYSYYKQLAKMWAFDRMMNNIHLKGTQLYDDSNMPCVDENKDVCFMGVSFQRVVTGDVRLSYES